MDDPYDDAASTGRLPVPDAVKLQILATEHWSLLATRSMTWSEMFARAGMFITVLSASIVSMALVAQATGFDDDFLVFAMLVLAITLLLGIGTMIRLADALEEDVWLMMGMNRLRNAYLAIAPELEPWFTTGHHDDIPGLLLSTGPDRRIGGAGRILSAIATTVAIINCLLLGVILALVTRLLTGSTGLAIGVGLAGTLASGTYVLIILPMQQIRSGLAKLRPRFPTPGDRDMKEQETTGS